MSAIFQRPLCEMGRAYDFAYRPVIGDPGPGLGGGCDTRPHRVDLCSAASDPGAGSVVWGTFALCDEHEGQLRTVDRERWAPRGSASRFRT
ncbi:MAG TPA: hypothetical protein VMG99_00335 [Thermoplasmata archaeon]|nr:hypothetical protein [Thermoplasmata archaeon]